jgi:excisionase family DNA binding protein
MAKILGVSRVSVYRMVERNAIPFLRLPSGTLRFNPRKVIASLESSGKQAK